MNLKFVDNFFKISELNRNLYTVHMTPSLKYAALKNLREKHINNAIGILFGWLYMNGRRCTFSSM